MEFRVTGTFSWKHQVFGSTGSTNPKNTIGGCWRDKCHHQMG
jgi:hypothetical protein